MPRTGIVADEPIRARECGEHLVNIAQRIIEQHDFPAGGAEARGEGLKPLAWPYPHRLTSARVHHDAAADASRRRNPQQVPVERVRERMPVFGAVRSHGRRQRVAQKNARAGARKTQPTPCAGEPEQRVIAGVASRGDAEIERLRMQFATHPCEFAPRPAMQAIFSAKRRPRRDEGHEVDLGREAGEQRGGVGLGQQRDSRMAGGGTQEWHGQREVAETPEFDNQQARRRQRVWRRFCQARGVKF